MIKPRRTSGRDYLGAAGAFLCFPFLLPPFGFGCGLLLLFLAGLLGPGSNVEPGEDLLAALRRELHEEHALGPARVSAPELL